MSPPTCTSPNFLKPTIIVDDDINQDKNPDDQFLSPPSFVGSQAHILVSGNTTDIPVDKENPMRCVECGEEFVNHFRYLMI